MIPPCEKCKKYESCSSWGFCDSVWDRYYDIRDGKDCYEECEEEMSKSLRIEITYDDFRDSEIAREKGYHRRKFYCPHCDLLVRIETWDDHRMFGLSTIMKDNIMPNYCPNCGEEIICEGTTD